MKIAFLGTGLMGEPMAQRLLAAGHQLNVFNRTTLKTEKLCKNGAVLAFKPADAIKESEIVITMLTDYSAVCDLLCTKKKIDFKGKTLIQMSTISPDESLLLKDRIESLGGEYMEAPVLSSIPQAVEGSLIIIVGATEEQFQENKIILESMGNKIHHVGEVGKASAAKLALNQLIATMISSFAMTLGYVRKKEIDPEKFMEVLRVSALYAPTYDKKLPNMLNDKYDSTNFSLKHLLKDVNLIANQFTTSGVDSSILESVKKVLEKGVQQKLEEKDYTVLYKILNPGK
jgi:3-hydroxyisobutyrate dehydrogenase